MLLNHGHPEAWSYPVGFLVAETQLVIERINHQEALRARLTSAAVSAAPNGMLTGRSQKKLMAAFDKLLKLLTEE